MTGASEPLSSSSINVRVLFKFSNTALMEPKMTAIASITEEEGLFELTLLNAETLNKQFDDVVVMGLSLGIPLEIITRLQSLWVATKSIAGEIVEIGKIIVQKIFDFIKANPALTLGLAIGAAVGVLVAGIPFLGPLLAPLIASLSMLYGAAVGVSIDSGSNSSDPMHLAIELAKKFFELLKEIFLAVTGYLTAD
jgi:hypothetical protein